MELLLCRIPNRATWSSVRRSERQSESAEENSESHSRRDRRPKTVLGNNQGNRQRNQELAGRSEHCHAADSHSSGSCGFGTSETRVRQIFEAVFQHFESLLQGQSESRCVSRCESLGERNQHDHAHPQGSYQLIDVRFAPFSVLPDVCRLSFCLFRTSNWNSTCQLEFCNFRISRNRNMEEFSEISKFFKFRENSSVCFECFASFKF